MNLKTSAPKSKQLADMIRERILSGKLKPGDFIESVREIAKRFKVSQQVARSAFDILRKEKLVVQEIGRGTFVNPVFKGNGARLRIGVYIHEDSLENGFYRALFHGCCRYGSQLGQDVFLLWDIGGVKNFGGKANLDFIIVSGGVDKALIEKLRKTGVPFVIVGNYENIPDDVNHFSYDIYSRFKRLTRDACSELKPCSVGIVIGNRLFPSSVNIGNAVMDHIHENKMEIKSPNVLFTTSRYGYEEIVEAWLDNPSAMPEVVLVTTPSYMAISRAIYERGLSVENRPKIVVWLDENSKDEIPYNDIASRVYSMHTPESMNVLMKWVIKYNASKTRKVLKTSYYNSKDMELLY